MPVKTKVIDTSATTPEAFLAGGAAPEAASQAPTPSAVPTAVSAPQQTPAYPPAEQPESPARPGLETPPAPQPAPTPDPFVVLQIWKGSTTHRALRALEVPGGCIIRLSSATGSLLTEALCFVPGVKVSEGKLIESKPFEEGHS